MQIDFTTLPLKRNVLLLVNQFELVPKTEITFCIGGEKKEEKRKRKKEKYFAFKR